MAVRRIVKRGNTFYVSIPKKTVIKLNIKAVEIEEKDENTLILHILR